MYLKKNIFFICFLFSTVFCFAQRVAIVGAMPEEIRLLTEALEKKHLIKYKDLEFYTGNLKGQSVVIMKSGIGKVNASYATTILLEKFKIKSVLFTGVAGGLHPNSYPGDLVIAEAVFHHDYARDMANEYEVRATRNIKGQKDNPLLLKTDSVLLNLAKISVRKISFLDVGNRNPKVFTGIIATGDTFINNPKKANWLYENFQALAVEMEGAALGQICYQSNIPFLIIRSCSDNANNSAHLDFQTFLKPAAENAIKVILGILEEM
jgi:adenosylhomocysteine nucleosidase